MTKADNKSKKNEIYEYTVFTQILRQTNKQSWQQERGRKENKKRGKFGVVM